MEAVREGIKLAAKDASELDTFLLCLLLHNAET